MTEEILYSFVYTGLGIINPTTPVALGADGSVYGTTQYGGASGLGAAYKLSNQTGWPFSVLHSFSKGTGFYPTVGMVFGPYGLLYGSNSWGFNNGSANFSLSPQGDSTEYKAIPLATTGEPSLGLTAVPHQSFLIGATANSLAGPGTVYAQSTASNGRGVVETEYTFGPAPDVDDPLTPPLIGYGAIAGSVIGCAMTGGANGYGGIFQITRPGNNPATESVIFNFPDSQYPYAIPGGGTCALVQADATGTIFGITGTNKSGVSPANDFFEVSPPLAPGGSWTEQSLLYFFTDNPEMPTMPTYPMAKIANKYYVALTSTSGIANRGAIVEITVQP